MVSYEELRDARRKAIGAKQTLKALEKGIALDVYIANDAEEHVVRPIRELAKSKGVPTIPVESMALLGKICGIEVGAAAATRLKE